MAWNEEGNGKDPWKRDGEEPNDLDKIVQDWQKRFGSILGGGGRGGGGSGGIVLIVMLLIAWGLTGFYRVDEAERGVVQRFGAFVEPVRNPGLRWHWPFPIETVDKVNIEEVNNFTFSTEMLTANEQYVLINLVVQYRRTDPVKYSFEVEDPETTLQDLTESALRSVVGTSSLEDLIGERREQIPARTMEELQETLTFYGAGLTITSINLRDVNYPQIVAEAVADTQRARNDRDRYKLEATTYTNDIIPKARGAAQRILQDAEAYRERVIADAEGESARFEALLAEYQKAPRVTRDRLYLDAVEEVYSRSSKIIIDSESSGNLMYLPIDKILEQAGRRVPSNSTGVATDSNLQPSQQETEQSLRDARERRTRE